MVINAVQKYIYGKHLVNSRSYHHSHNLHFGLGEELVNMLDIIQIMGLATAVADFTAAQRMRDGKLMSQSEYGLLVGNILLDLLESSEDHSLRRLAEQTKEIRLIRQEKK